MLPLVTFFSTILPPVCVYTYPSDKLSTLTVKLQLQLSVFTKHRCCNIHRLQSRPITLLMLLIFFYINVCPWAIMVHVFPRYQAQLLSSFNLVTFITTEYFWRCISCSVHYFSYCSTTYKACLRSLIPFLSFLHWFKWGDSSIFGQSCALFYDAIEIKEVFHDFWLWCIRFTSRRNPMS